MSLNVIENNIPAHDGKVGLNTTKYIIAFLKRKWGDPSFSLAFLYYNWLYFLWLAKNLLKRDWWLKNCHLAWNILWTPKFSNSHPLVRQRTFLPLSYRSSPCPWLMQTVVSSQQFWKVNFKACFFLAYVVKEKNSWDV